MTAPLNLHNYQCPSNFMETSPFFFKLRKKTSFFHVNLIFKKLSLRHSELFFLSTLAKNIDEN